MTQQNTNVIRGIVETFYDVQTLRIAVENQLRSFEQEVSEQERTEMKALLLDGLAETEKSTFKYIENYVEDYPIYTEWMAHIVGIGPTIAGGFIAWYGNVRNFETISKLWGQSGLAVTEEGRAVRKQKGVKLSFNPRIKTHCWKLGESLVKHKGALRSLYEQSRAEYDEKWITSEDCGSVGCISKGKGKCMKGHRYAASKRKVVKIFLACLHMKWRELEGLPVDLPFIIGRGKHEHLIKPEDLIG